MKHLDKDTDQSGPVPVSQHRPKTTTEDGPTPPEVRELSNFQRDVLFVVAGADEPSGQEIKRELEATTMEMVLPGQLYPNLAQLAELDLVEKSARDGRTSAYDLTERGSRVIGDLCEWQKRHLQAEPSGVVLEELQTP